MNSSNYNEEEFESLNDIETVLSSIGIKLRENAKEWRDIDDVLQDIADSWDNWDKTTQNAVATAIAGTRQRENVLQLFDNWDEVDKYAEIAANSYGTATEKMEAYTDSVEAAQQRIQVAIEDWALWANGAGLIKDFYNAIGFAIKNIDDLIIAFSALAIALNLGGVINTFTNGLTVLASKVADIGMTFDRVKMNFATGKSTTVSAATSGFSNVREDFIFTQQQMFGQVLAKYTNTLNAQDAQAVQNMQKEMLRMSAKDKLMLSEILLSDNNTQMTSAQLKSITDENKKHLANSLLLVTQNEKVRTVLQEIASGKDLNVSQKNLDAINDALVEVKQKEYRQIVAGNMNKSGKMGEPGSMIANGAGMLVGGAAGAFGFGSMGESLLGDQGKIYGTMLGSMVGSYAGKSLVGAIMGVVGGASWTTLLGPIGLALGLVGVAGWAIWKKHREKEIEETQKAFKEAEEKFSNAKGSNVTAKQFDELANGVDKYGRNVALSEEEYQNFLDKSNELAELFPELIVRTDEEGNKLVGLGNAVGGVTEKVAELTKQLQHEADIKLLDENIFGEDFNDTYKQIADLEDKINGLKEGTTDTDLLKSTYDKYGVDYTTMSFQGGEIITSVEDEEKAFKARQNMVRDYENEIKNLKKAMSNYVMAEERELRYGEDASSKAFSKRIESMTDDQKTIYQNAVSGINIEKKDSDGNYIRKTDQEIQDEILRVADLVDETFNKLGKENIDIAFKSPESYDTLEEMQKARKQLMDALMSIFGADGVIDDMEAQVIIGLGFEVGDNKIEDPQDILGKLKNEFNISETNGENGISIENLQKLNLEDIQKAMKMFNDGTLQATSSMSTLVNMLYADRPMPTTLSGMTEYVTEQGELLGQLGQKVTDFFDNNTWQNINANEYFSEYPEAIRNTIAEAQEELKDGGEKTQEMVDEIAESAITSFQATLFNNLGKVEELKLDKVFGESITSDIDGFIDSFSELKTAIEEISSAYEDLSSAQKEQATNGKLSLQTVLDLVTSNENYLRVLDFETDSVTGNTTAIKLQDDAAKKVALAQMQTVQSNLKLAITENEATIASNEHRKQLVMQALEALQTANANEGQVASNQDVAETTVASTKTMGQYAGMLAGIGAIIDAIVNKQWGSIAEAYNNAKNSVATQVDDFIAQTTNYTDWQAKYGEMNADELYAELDSINEDNERLRDTNDIYKYVTGQKLTLDNIGDFVTKDLGADTGSSGNGKTDNGKTDNGKTELEKLQALESAINKEWEAKQALDENRYTKYFDKMRNVLQAQESILKTSIDTAKTDEERLDFQKQLQEVQVKLFNLKDEEIEDEISRLNNREASVEALIEQQKLLLQEADTEDEVTERQKELNDLLRQERDLRKSINEYQNELLDTQLQYNSGTAYSDSKTYDNLVNQKIENYKKNAEIALEAIEAETRLAYNELIQEVDDKGNKLYTAQEAWYKAQNSEKVQQATKEYIEAVQAQAEVAVQAVTDKLDEISREIDMLEKQKPQEWSSIDQIKDYADSTIDYLNKKLAVIQDALKDTSGMTDDQIKDLVDQLNEVTIAIHEAQIQMHEDIKNQQEATYSALVNQVQRYIDELEDAKDAVEDAYKDPIEDIEDYNKALDRTNKLLELQKNLQNASREKQRVKDMPSIKMAI